MPRDPEPGNYFGIKKDLIDFAERNELFSNYISMIKSGREMTTKEKYGIIIGGVIEYLEPCWKSKEVEVTSLNEKMSHMVIEAKELGTKSLASELLV